MVRGSRRSVGHWPRTLAGVAAMAAVGVPLPDRAAAQTAADDVLSLPAIEVTGGKKVETTADTSASVAVVTRQRIGETAPSPDVYGVFRHMGNVLAPTAGNLGLSIRGVDADGASIGAMQTVTGAASRASVFVDGVPQSYNSAFRGGIGTFGNDQVELYRGSQSTLHGPNSIAGAVVVNTLAPSFVWEGQAEARAGRFGEASGGVTLAGPLSSQAAFRLTAEGYRRNSDISYTNPAVVAADPSPDEEWRRAFSGKLLITPEAVPDLALTVGYRNASERRSHWDVVDLNSDKRRYSGTSFAGVFTVNPQSLFANADYRLSDRWTFSTVNSYSWFDETLREPAGNSAEFTYRIGQLATEQRLAFGAPGDRLRAMAGVYVARRSADESVRRPLSLEMDDTTTTVAGFGEGTVRLLDRLELTAGGRWERHRQERVGTRNLGFGASTLDTTVTSTALLPKAGLRYHLTDEASVGASARKGYHPGGSGNTLLSGTFFQYAKEETWTYEVDVRSSFLHDRLRLSANLFHTDHTDQQVGDGAGFEQKIVNVPESTSQGIELEAAARISPELDVFASVGLLRTRFEGTPSSGPDLTGHDFARAPSITASVGAIYRLASGFYASADAQYVGGYQSDIQNLDVNTVDARFIANAEVGWRLNGLSVFAYGRNLFDSDAETYVWTAQNVKALVPPLTAGLGVRAEF